MTWIFSRALIEACENLRSSLEREEEYSAAGCLDGEPYAQLSVMPTQHKFWYRDKTMDASNLSRFGLTLKLLTESHGEELLTLYLEGSRAKTYQWQGRGLESKERKADCGRTWQGLFARLDQDSCLWKTAQGSLIMDSEKCCVIFPPSGIMQDGVCWELVMLVPRIYERGSGYWHTMTANDSKPAGLKEIAMVRAHENGQSVPNTYIRLRSQVAVRSNKAGPMNPMWCEWLMGFPLGWTDLSPLGMPKLQDAQQQHGVS